MKKKTPIIVHFFRVYFSTVGLVFKKSAARQLIKLFSTPRKKVIRRPEIVILSEAQKSNLKMDGVNIIVYQWGAGERLALFFHGWESNAGSLGAFVHPLLERGFKIVSFDAPAHGRSGGKRANLVYFKSIAKQIIEKYGVPEFAVGHSLGANSVIMTAYENQFKIPKVVLISPLDYLMSVFDEMKDLLKIPNPLFEVFIRKFGKEAGYDLNGFYFHGFAVKTNLEKVLILHDEKDKVTDFSHAESLNNNWNIAHLIPIKNSGHYRILWAKQTVKAIVDFVDN